MANALEDFALFEAITESWELIQTGLIVIKDQSYRLELWESYSNPDIRYYVSISIRENDVWRKMPDSPFPVAQSGDEAMRTAMAFLSERQAA